MRTPDRILIATALGLLSGLSAASDSRARRASRVGHAPPGGITPRRSDRCAAAACADSTRGRRVSPAAMPNAALPRPTAPVPSVGAPQAAPLGRPVPVPPPTAFAAPPRPDHAVRGVPVRCPRAAGRQKEKALVSLEYAADQGVVAAQWKLGRMYAEGRGRRPVRHQGVRVSSAASPTTTPDDTRGRRKRVTSPTRSCALGHYYRDAASRIRDVKRRSRPRAPHVPVCGVLLRRCRRAVSSGADDARRTDRPTIRSRRRAGSTPPRTRGSIRRRRCSAACCSSGESGPSAAAGARPDVADARAPNAGLRPKPGSRESYDSALKQATDDERALAADIWRAG